MSIEQISQEEINRRISIVDKINPKHIDFFYNNKKIHFNTKLNENTIDYISHYMCVFESFYELSILQHIEKNHYKQKTILDIGANVGNHACFFENFLDFEKIICFEPHSENFKVLCSNIKSPKTIAYPIAVSDVVGKGSMISPLWYNAGTYHLTSGNDINVVELDGFLNQIDIHDVTLMKIDVEGHELNVLKGAKQLLKRDHPVIYLEVHTSEERPNEEKILTDFLKEFNYKVRAVIEFDGMYHLEFV